MSVLGSNALQNLFYQFLDTELTYNREVSAALGFLPSGSTLKLLGRHFPCVIHSSSFEEAKVLLRLPGEIRNDLETGSKLAALSLVFFNAKLGKNEIFQMYGAVSILQVQAGPEGFVSLFLSLSYNHRPPDTFLELQGAYLSLQKEIHQRREERISLNQTTADHLGLASLNTIVSIEQIDRRCLLREISYGGAKIVLNGLGQYLTHKPFELQIHHLAKGKMLLPGHIMRAEEVEGHRELAVIGLKYQAEKVPVEYLQTVQKALKVGLGRSQQVDQGAKDYLKRHGYASGPQTSRIDLNTLRLKKS